jgi:preprotein translocase subunit SecG
LASLTKLTACLEKLTKKNINEMEKKSNEVINPTNIIAAGRNIKSAVYVILVMVVFTLIVLLYSSKSSESGSFTNQTMAQLELWLLTENPETFIKRIYIVLGFVSIMCNIIILFQLHSAGDNLENSVNK